MDRNPAVAGLFYPGDPVDLKRTVDGLLVGADREVECPLGVVSPHAGYVYSGPVAGRVFGSVHVPPVCIILAPNHTGMHMAEVSVWPEGKWFFPGMEIEVDAELAAAIVEAFPGAEADTSAHVREHAVEVQIPFLLARNPEVRIVPVVVSMRRLEGLLALGGVIADVVEESGKDVLVVASTDMTHYEPDEIARRKDRLAVDRIMEIDPEGLYEVVMENDVSMCGVFPTTVMLAFCRRRGAENTALVAYATSGDASGDYSSVVGYAGIIVS